MNQSKPRRRRGIVLSKQGLKRLQQGIQKAETRDNNGDRYTLEALAHLISIDPKTIAKVLAGKIGTDKRTIQRCFTSFNLELQENDYHKPDAVPSTSQQSVIDLSEAIDISQFYGRYRELNLLQQWLRENSCNVVAILGMGGVGKTSLAVKLASQATGEFDYIIWRSLRNAIPLQEILGDWLQILCPEHSLDLSLHLGKCLPLLLQCLQKQRCLLILDNWETLLRSSAETQKEVAGLHLQEFVAYGDLLNYLGSTFHKSCLVLTSREKPAEIAVLEGENLPVRTMQIGGLQPKNAQEILQDKGIVGSTTDYESLINLYQGNALALKIVATAIQDIFAGDIQEFLAQSTTVFNGIRALLSQQFQRLSNLEKNLIYWLAINREPISLKQIREDLVTPIAIAKLLEVLESLGRRCLMETIAPAIAGQKTLFTLQPVVMEYVTDILVEKASQEINQETPLVLASHSLMKAQTKDYLRNSQRQLIIQPIIEELLGNLGSKTAIIQQIKTILKKIKNQAAPQHNYLVGNLINFLCHLKVDLTGYDFSHLAIWQAYLQETPLQGVNFTSADLSKSVFAKTFPAITCLALSPDGQFLATGHSDYQIRLWSLKINPNYLQAPLMATLSGHGSIVWSLGFSQDNSMLASASEDCTIKLWQVNTGLCTATLLGHTDWIHSLTLANQDSILISGSADSTIRIWDVVERKCLQTWLDHEDGVWFVAEKQGLVASCSDDLTVKIWDLHTGECLQTLRGHEDRLRCVSFSPSGKLLVSGGLDCTLKVWDVATGKLLQNLVGYHSGILSITFFQDDNCLATAGLDDQIKFWDLSLGRCTRTLSNNANSNVYLVVHPLESIVISGGSDQAIRFWNFHNGQCLQTLQGRVNWISSVAYNSQGTTIVSGGEDGMVRLWNLQTGKGEILRGHADTIYSVAFHPNGHTVASSSVDRTLRLWNVKTRDCYQICQGHNAPVTSMAFSPRDNILVTGSWDETIRIWDLKKGQCLQTFSDSFVMSLAFHPQGNILAVGGFQEVVKLLDMDTGQSYRTLEGHESWAWCVAFHPQGEILATASIDGVIKIWNLVTGECFCSFKGHQDWIWELHFHPQGNILVSVGHDQCLKLWDVATGQCLRKLNYDNQWVMGATFSPDGKNLASGWSDSCVRVWEVETGKCLRTFKAERLYEGMNISQVKGLTKAQKEALQLLGGVF